MKKLLFISTLASFLACSKNSSSNDRELPVITLHTPVQGQTYPGGTLIAITGTISDNNSISQVHIHISNAQTGTLLIDVHRYPGNSSFTLNESFQAESGTSYKIQVIAKDNSANESRATVEISAN